MQLDLPVDRTQKQARCWKKAAIPFSVVRFAKHQPVVCHQNILSLSCSVVDGFSQCLKHYIYTYSICHDPVFRVNGPPCTTTSTTTTTTTLTPTHRSKGGNTIPWGRCHWTRDHEYTYIYISILMEKQAKLSRRKRQLHTSEAAHDIFIHCFHHFLQAMMAI